MLFYPCRFSKKKFSAPYRRFRRSRSSGASTYNYESFCFPFHINLAPLFSEVLAFAIPFQDFVVSTCPSCFFLLLCGLYLFAQWWQLHLRRNHLRGKPTRLTMCLPGTYLTTTSMLKFLPPNAMIIPFFYDHGREVRPNVETKKSLVLTRNLAARRLKTRSLTWKLTQLAFTLLPIHRMEIALNGSQRI